MPAYFNLTVQFLRQDLKPLFVKEFHQVLEQAGLHFKCGCWNAEADSQEAIMEWNQNLLEQDFDLGETESYLNDYKQVLFQYGGYREVRGFWMNRYPEDENFSFEIIVPESEVLELTDTTFFNESRIRGWVECARIIWLFEPVKSIQTGLELSDAPTGTKEMEQGREPLAFPFAVIGGQLSGVVDRNFYKIKEVERGGIIVETKDIKKWYPPKEEE